MACGSLTMAGSAACTSDTLPSSCSIRHSVPASQLACSSKHAAISISSFHGLFNCGKVSNSRISFPFGTARRACRHSGVSYVGVRAAQEHYKDLSSKPFFPKLVQYITSGPVVCIALEGSGVVASARKLIGVTNPLQAEPGTIRGDLGIETGRNVIHGSDSPENGDREIALWFKEGELCEWEPTLTPWLRE